MSGVLRDFTAFGLGCLGVALAFWGVLEGARLHHLLAFLSVPVGAVLLLLAFRVSPSTEPASTESTTG